MEKPKIVSVKDTLDLVGAESEVPELPGSVGGVQQLAPSLPEGEPTSLATTRRPQDSPEEHVQELPFERSTIVPSGLSEPSQTLQESQQGGLSLTGALTSSKSSTTALSAAPSTASPPPVLQTVVSAPVEEPGSTSLPSVTESTVASNTGARLEDSANAENVSAVETPPAGAPPWVEREAQTPTVAEATGPVSVYPGVGRPKVQSISHSTVKSSSVASHHDHWTHHHVHTEHVKPTHAHSPHNKAEGKLYERPELDAERFAEELTAQDNAPARRDVVKEYREAASRDMLPPQASPKPMTIEHERARAKVLAQQIHAQSQQMGFVGKLKRMFGLR